MGNRRSQPFWHPSKLGASPRICADPIHHSMRQSLTRKSSYTAAARFSATTSIVRVTPSARAAKAKSTPAHNHLGFRCAGSIRLRSNIAIGTWRPKLGSMNPFKSPFILVLAVAIAMVGCASTTQTSTQNKESMLVAAGFKTITPKTSTQQQKLQQLPPGKIAMIQKSGKTFYVYPDAAHNQAYVGGPQEYQAYEQARAANKLAQENLETAEMYQDANDELGSLGRMGSRLGSNGNGRRSGRRF